MLHAGTFLILKAMKQLNTILLLCVFVISCSSSDNNATVMQNTQLVAKGYFMPQNGEFNPNDQYLAITSQNQWDNIIGTLQDADPDILEGFTETDIDFNAFEVIAVIQKKNSSTTVDITNVAETQNNIIVTVKNLSQSAIQDVAYPYHFIKIEKSNKPVVFE